MLKRIEFTEGEVLRLLELFDNEPQKSEDEILWLKLRALLSRFPGLEERSLRDAKL